MFDVLLLHSYFAFSFAMRLRACLIFLRFIWMVVVVVVMVVESWLLLGYEMTRCVP